MTETLLSLISIFIGIIAANLFGYFWKKYSFGFTGNTLVGVFGSALFIKTFGRLGFSPWAITNNGDFYGSLLIINILVSGLGGIALLIFIKWLLQRLTKK